MLRRLLIATVLAAGLGAAHADAPSPGEPRGGAGISQDGLPLGACETFELPSSSWATPALNGSSCTLVPLGGGGSAPVLAFPSCLPIDGNAQVYLGAGGCSDALEVSVQTRVKTAVLLGQLACQTSGVVSQSVSVMVRVGACGGLSNSSTTCTIAAAGDNCTSTGTVSVSAGECFALQVSPSAGLSSTRQINCSMQRVG